MGSRLRSPSAQASRVFGRSVYRSPALFCPKKAITLTAGAGSRLRSLMDLRPKPLVEVNGAPILYNGLRNLEAVSDEEVTLVVGYRKQAIQYACAHRLGTLVINYAELSIFDTTGRAYSLWLARDAPLSGDCFSSRAMCSSKRTRCDICYTAG